MSHHAPEPEAEPEHASHTGSRCSSKHGPDDSGGATPPILAMFYSEFDNEAGPVLFCQAPNKFVTPEQFDHVSQYVIPKSQLYGKIVSFTAFGYLIVGFPVCIEHKRYGRNALIFNVGMVLRDDPQLSRHRVREVFAPVVRGLAMTFRELECESRFLFSTESLKEQMANSDGNLQRILAETRDNLNAHGHCAVNVDGVNTLYLKLGRRGDPVSKRICSHEVPVLLVERAQLVRAPISSDLKLKKVLSLIDGVRYVKLIAHIAETSEHIVGKCLAYLWDLRVIEFVDIFQFSNYYTTTAGIGLLISDSFLTRECIQNCTRLEPAEIELAASKWVRLCSHFQAGKSMKQFCLDNFRELEDLKVDIRSLVVCGVVRGFLRRIHAFPVKFDCLERSDATELEGSTDEFPQLSAEAQAMEREVDGVRSCDELCTEYGWNMRILQEVLQDSCILLYA